MKQPPENPQTRIMATLDRWQNPSWIMPLNLVWVVSLGFYLPPYSLPLVGLLVGLGAVTWFLLVSKAILKGWIKDKSWPDTLGLVAFQFLAQYFSSSVGILGWHDLSIFNWAICLLQLVCMVLAVQATVNHYGRGAIDLFLGLPSKGTLPPATGGQLKP